MNEKAITVKQYFDHEDVSLESISGGVFNQDAWPRFRSWSKLESACDAVVAEHPDLPFIGYKTLGMLMGWAMQRFTKETGENVPPGWYAVVKQLQAMPGSPPLPPPPPEMCSKCGDTVDSGKHLFVCLTPECPVCGKHHDPPFCELCPKCDCLLSPGRPHVCPEWALAKKQTDVVG